MMTLRLMACAIAVVVTLATPGVGAAPAATSDEPIRIAILQSQTGTMAISEAPLVDAAQLAVDEINAAGGIGGRQLEAVVIDTQSDWDRAAREADRLLKDGRVSSIFGCWTSDCRKALLPVLQRRRGLLWYPVQYEGRETSPYVIYTGATPNQQILPAFDWAREQFGRRVYLVGSDYVFPRTANLTIRERAATAGASIVGERYIPLGGTDVHDIVADIVAKRPDVVINTINGDTNIQFFSELELATASKRIPTLSFSIAEGEIRTIGAGLLKDSYVAWNYFQSLATPENAAFVDRYRSAYGQAAVTSDPIDSAYMQLLAFAEAASNAKDTSARSIRDAARGLALDTPGGYVRIDAKTQHTWKTVRLGQVMSDGQVREIGDSVVPVEPSPYAGGAAAVPPLVARPARAPTLSPQAFDESLLQPGLAASAALALRSIGELGWSTIDQRRALGAAAESKDPRLRNESARAVKAVPSARADVMAGLLRSKDGFDQVAAMDLLKTAPRVDPTMAARAADLLTSPLRRVRLAAADALLAQARQGWRADESATSHIIAALRDHDLAVQRAALSLTASSDSASRVVPMLASAGLASRPQFYRRPLCKAAAESLESLLDGRIKAGDDQTVSAAAEAVTGLEAADCLDGSQLARLRLAVSRADGRSPTGPTEWLGSLYRLNFAAGVVATVLIGLVLIDMVLLLVGLLLVGLKPVWLMHLLERLRPLDRIRVDISKLGLDVSVFDALSITWFRHNRRALLAWVESDLPSCRRIFERERTVGARRQHVPLPVSFDDQTTAVEPSAAAVRELLRGDSARVHILGEGGTGKTSLACLLARWAMSSDADQRIGGLGRDGRPQPWLAVLVEPGSNVKASPEGLFEFIGRELREAGAKPVPGWLVEGLVRRGMVVVVLDDVFELDGPWQEVLVAASLRDLNLVVTSRTPMPADMGDWHVVRPQRLRGAVLTKFITDYALLTVDADKLGDDDIDRFVQEFKALLGNDESRQDTVVFFARLFVDYKIDLEFGDQGEHGFVAPAQRLGSIAELVENFVDYTCRHVPSNYNVDPIEVVALIRSISWLTLSERPHPGPFSLGELVTSNPDLASDLGIPPDVDLHELLADCSLLDRPSARSFRFKIDLVQEYCAVLHVRDRALETANKDKALAEWSRWVDCVTRDKDETAAGLLDATFECLRSDRAGTVSPAFIERVAELAGVGGVGLQPVRIGILHSLQGTMSISETALRDAALLAVDEINAGGGIGGRPIEPIVRDGASDAATFAREARRLIYEDGVTSIFGCWTSTDRKAVKPIVESGQALLWYPVQYEGYERSDSIVYGGAAPNQQITPAAAWCLDTLLPSRGIAPEDVRIYLVGSDYVFPTRAHRILRRYLADRGVVPVGERLVPLASTDFADILAEIRSERANVVINTLNGSSNISFFQTMSQQGVHADTCPVVSLSIAEAEVRDIGVEHVQGHYAVWNYFQSRPGAANERFVTSFQQKYGLGRVTSDPMATAYTLVTLFAEAMRHARSSTREELRLQLQRVAIDTPEGHIRFDGETGHFHKHVYLGRVNESGQFDIVESWRSEALVAPEPYPYPDLTDEFASADDGPPPTDHAELAVGAD